MRVQGFDVTTTITGPNGPELVGQWQEIDLSIKNEIEEYMETGERIAMLLDGDIKIDGKLKKGLAHTNVMSRVFGVKTMKRGTRIPPQPRFTISFSINAPEKGLVGRYRLLNCVIPELALSIRSGKAVVDKNLNYQAEGIEEA